MSDGDKEKIKLRAAFLNGMALIFFSLGVLAPIVGAIYVANIARERAVLAAVTALVCFGITIGLHLWATRHLGRLP